MNFSEGYNHNVDVAAEVNEGGDFSGTSATTATSKGQFSTIETLCTQIAAFSYDRAKEIAVRAI